LDIDQTARQLGITPDGVRKRIVRGSLKATKVGSRWDIVLDTGQDKTGQRPGQQDRDTPLRGGGDQSSRQDPLITALQEQIAGLQEQLRVMNQALTSRDKENLELVTVVRQSQAMLQAPEARARRPWWKIW